MCKPLLTVLIPVIAFAAGCTSPGDPNDPRYRTIAADPRRDTDLARARNHRAKALLADRDYPAAENVLKQALDADPFYGPAHNNLGIAYLKQDKLYLAAWEFQYAVKLLPGKPEPKNNLGLVMEQANRLKEAQAQYQQAMSAEPDNPEYIANLARANLRLGQRDAKTANLLRQLILKDTRPEWTEWAREELSRMPKDALQTPATQEATPTSQNRPANSRLSPLGPNRRHPTPPADTADRHLPPLSSEKQAQRQSRHGAG